MFEKLEIVRMAQAMASYAGTRQGLIAENVANADTPGYRARDLNAFADTYYEPGHGMRQTRAGHIATDRDFAAEISGGHVAGADSPNGNGVSLESEMLRAADTQRQHDMALSIYRNASNVLRSSLGRSR